MEQVSDNSRLFHYCSFILLKFCLNFILVTSQLMYDEVEQSWLFSAIAIGTLIGTLPSSYLTTTIGMK